MESKKTKCNDCKLIVESTKKWIGQEYGGRHAGHKIIILNLCSSCYQKREKQWRWEKKLWMVILVGLIIFVIMIFIIRYAL